jgi:hypothetical protein
MAEKSEPSRSTDKLTAKIARSRERVQGDFDRTAIRIGFSRETAAVVPALHYLLAERGRGCGRVDSAPTTARKENLHACAKQWKNKEQICGRWLCFGCAEHWREPNPARDSRIREEPTESHRAWTAHNRPSVKCFVFCLHAMVVGKLFEPIPTISH